MSSLSGASKDNGLLTSSDALLEVVAERLDRLLR